MKSIAILLFAAFIFLGPPPNAAAQQAPAPKIRVFVIGIGEFVNIPTLNVPGLKASITFECNDIASYFNDRFGKNVQVNKYCTADETTREAVRRYLSIDLRNGGADDLNFVFLMSHGIPIKYANQFLASDVEIVTSDTKEEDQEFTSISAATELLPWLQKLSNLSTTVFFLDVCYAGNAENLSTQLSSSLQGIFGIKNLVIASSLAKDQSYQAAFTAAVMNIIRSGECVPAQDLDRKIADTIHGFTSATLNGTEGFPDVIVPYVGSLCLGDMGEDGKLLFIYTGQEPKTTKYRIAGTVHNSVEGPTYIQNPFFTRRENSDKYTIYIQRAGQAETAVKTLDLTASDFDVAWIDAGTNYADAAQFLQSAATITQMNGNPPDTAATLRLGASAIYRAHNDVHNYKTVLNSVPVEIRNRLIPPTVAAAAFHADSVQALARDPETDPNVLARQLALSGDFKNAAFAAKLATERAQEVASKGKAAETEYLLLGASGNVTEATKVRRQASLDIKSMFPSIYLAEKKAVQTGKTDYRLAYQDLSALGAVTAITRSQNY